MRLIGTLPDTAQARRFVAYLHTVNIEAVEEESSSGRQIWVRDEDQVERAKTELTAFRDDPAAGKYLAAEKQSRELAKTEQVERTKRRDRVVTGKDIWRNVGGPPSRRLPVTWALIGASIVCTAIISFGSGGPSNWALEWSEFASKSDVARYMVSAYQRGEEVDQLPLSVIFGKILQGQVWRLVTPIFFHFGMLHLIFNMIWLYQLGGQIEDRVRAWRYVLLILFFALAGNVAQAVAPFSLGGSPIFGGMSGVVYGCFGYVWIKSLIDPRAGYRISTFAVLLMIGWHIATSMPGREELFGELTSNVAAWAHGGGLVAGMLAAGATFLLKRSRA